MQIRSLSLLSAAISNMGGTNFKYGDGGSSVIAGGCNCHGPYQAVQAPAEAQEDEWGGTCGVIGDAIGSCASLFSSLTFGGLFEAFCNSAALDPLTGQLLALNVTAAIGGLDHATIQKYTDTDVLAQANGLAMQYDIPLDFVGSVSGGMAEVLYAKDSTASPQFGTYAAINRVVYNAQNTGSVVELTSTAVEGNALVATTVTKNAGLVGRGIGALGLFAFFI
ncbi:hypothetical protein HDU98_008512 [Podochytrium sp. JEL0797]|nr:hypothetical protein HDU98_008512 [Podochytrium sp. JEL0797]